MINEFFKFGTESFVGDKSKQDIKSITPIVNQIKALEETYKALSIDELRAKTADFKKQISEACSDILAQ